MNTLMLTGHATIRMAQRGIDSKDAELIALVGTEVEGGYLVRNKDYQELERQLKGLLQRLRRVTGKRLIVDGSRVVTAYHASVRQKRRLMRKQVSVTCRHRRTSTKHGHKGISWTSRASARGLANLNLRSALAPSARA